MKNICFPLFKSAFNVTAFWPDE